MIDFQSGCDYVIQGDNEAVLPKLPDGSFQLLSHRPLPWMKPYGGTLAEAGTLIEDMGR